MMLITKLILKGYKRLMLNNIKEFEYTPNSTFQLILGTNGSGKSSLLKELSPLPAFPGDYTKEGSKTIELEENNNIYRLESTFKNGGKHTFIRNGEILNDAGTAAVQKELIEKYFHYTNEIHDLLVGDVQLTDMSPQKRREWFTKLSSNDLTYAVNIFNALKSRFRDTQGAQSHINKRLTVETNRLLSLTDIENIDNRVESLKSDIVIFLESKDSQYSNPDQTYNDLFALITKIKNISDEIITNQLSPKLGNFSSLSDLENYCTELQNNYQLAQHTLKMKTTEYADMENLLLSVKRAGVAGIDELQDKQIQLNNKLSTLESNYKLFKAFNVGNLDSIIPNNHDVIRLVENVLNQLPINEDNYFSKGKIQETEKTRTQLREQLSLIRATKSRAESRYEHVKSAKESECPKCQYVWKPGISENELQTLLVKIEQCDKERIQLEDQLDTADRYLEKADEYISLWRQYKNIVDNNTQNFALWDYFLETNLVLQAPKKAISVLYTWMEDVDIAQQCLMVRKELANIDVAIEAANAIESLSGICAFQDRITNLTNDINTLTISVTDKQQELQLYSKIFNETQSVLLKYQTLEKYLDDAESLFLDYQKGLKNTILHSSIGEMNSSLGQIQNKLNEKQTIEALITDLTRDSEWLDKDYECFKVLIDELSPVNGLIADQLYGNIRCIISQMNEIIAHVWTYDMEILPCGQESNDLDYKFPLQIRSADNKTSDIKEASDGQIEIINFAFKLVVMLYLDMSNYPLYLDELGQNLDEQHRANTMNYLKLLIDTKRHSQLFFVSHIATQYGSMSAAEVCVLDSTNVSTPMAHNQHVKFK